MITSLDALLTVIALVVMASGLCRRASLWRMGRRDAAPTGSLAGLGKALVTHRKLMERRGAGLAHAALFWGVLLSLLAAVAAQFHPQMPDRVAAAFSLLLDLLGVGALSSTLFFLARRWRAGGNQGSEGPRSALLPALLLLLILVTGFLAEGARLAILSDAFSWKSPAGSLLSTILPASPLFMQMAIRCHFFAVLLLIALLPFTFTRHLVTASVSVFYKKEASAGALGGAFLDGDTPGARRVQDFSWKQLMEADACVSCGRCEENCPASISGKPLSPMKIMRKIREGMEEAHEEGRASGHASTDLDRVIMDDEIWSCTTCLACVEQCPVCAEPAGKIIDMRRYRLMGAGRLPSEAKSMLRNLELYGDVHGRGIAHRGAWAFNLGIPPASSQTELLLWVGCSGAFHPRYQAVARDMVKILEAAGVSFSILGKGELCCGDPARRLGEESLFLHLAQRNMKSIQEHGVRNILTLCPHCYNVLKNEYSSLGACPQVVHSTEYMAGLIRSGRITLTYPLPARTALHDPCYLGRGNGLYEPLREIGRSVEGMDLVELPASRERSLCCGGGGGMMWIHEAAGRRINHIRAQEVVRTGSRILATACPYCLTMLEDGLKSCDADHPPRVLDLVEIVAGSIG